MDSVRAHLRMSRTCSARPYEGRKTLPGSDLPCLAPGRREPATSPLATTSCQRATAKRHPKPECDGSPRNHLGDW